MLSDRKPLSGRELTADTTKRILNDLFQKGIFSWRNSVGAASATYTNKAGETKTRYMQMGKVGSPDIEGILPTAGKYLGIEIKTGKDRLREQQIGFHTNAKRMGALILVVKDFEDYQRQFSPVFYG